MREAIAKLEEEIKEFATSVPEELEQFRIRVLGSKGAIKELFKSFKEVPADQKKEVGQLLNQLRVKAEEKFNALKQNSQESTDETDMDLTLPGEPFPVGSRHPIAQVNDELIQIFTRLGFKVSEGPEIEDDWHIFGALNFPPEHPARDMQDTFFVQKDPDFSLRSHTSSVQARIMESEEPPIRAIIPGRVYRNEAISARSHCMFHQMEGIYIDKGVSFADLKYTMQFFAKEMFGKNVQIRLRPSYFPFTEPSAEMDVSCTICQGDGCNICKYTGWVEILGCGMIDPNVLSNCGIDPEVYSGFAFGMGYERMTMIKYQINDLRLFFQNDLNFLRQFSSF